MDTKEEKSNKKYSNGSNGGGAVYAMGFAGALIYYIQHSYTFTQGLLGLLKAIVWPAILIHKIFSLLGL